MSLKGAPPSDNSTPPKSMAVAKSSKDTVDVVIIVIGRVLSIALGFATIKIMTTYLPPNSVGRLSLLNAIVGWFGLIAVNPVGMYVNRRFHEWSESNALRSNLLRFFQYLLAVSAIAAIVLSAVSITTEWIGTLELIAVCLAVYFLSANTQLVSLFNLRGDRSLFVILSVLTVLISLSASAALTYMSGATGGNWLLGQALGSATLFFVTVVIWRRKVGLLGTGAPDPMRTVLLFAAPLAANVLFYWVQTQGYRFIVGSIAGDSVLGIFSISFGIPLGAMASFESLFSQFYLPKFYHNVSKGEVGWSAACNQYASALFPYVILCALYLGSFSKDIARLLVAPGYPIATELLLLGTAFESLRIGMAGVSLFAHATRSPSDLLLPGFIAAAVGSGLVFVLAGYDPLLGTGVALVIGVLTGFVGMWLRFRRRLRLKFPVARILKACLLGLPFVAIAVALEIFLGARSTWSSIIILGLTAPFLVLAQKYLYESVPAQSDPAIAGDQSIN